MCSTCSVHLHACVHVCSFAHVRVCLAGHWPRPDEVKDDPVMPQLLTVLVSQQTHIDVISHKPDIFITFVQHDNMVNVEFTESASMCCCVE